MSATRYFLYADDLPIEPFPSPAAAYARRNALLERRKVTRLFALHPDKHLWREWIHVLGASEWHDVEPTHVPFRLLVLDRP